MRVVAVRATNDNHHIALLRQFDRCALTLLSRLADGVNEAHLRFRIALADQLHQPSDFFNGLRGL